MPKPLITAFDDSVVRIRDFKLPEPPSDLTLLEVPRLCSYRPNTYTDWHHVTHNYVTVENKITNVNITMFAQHKKRDPDTLIPFIETVAGWKRNQPFRFKISLPGRKQQVLPGPIGIGFGQYALDLHGNGDAYLWKSGLGEGDTGYRENWGDRPVKKFLWSASGGVEGPSCRVAAGVACPVQELILDVVPYGKNRILFLTNQGCRTIYYASPIESTLVDGHTNYIVTYAGKFWMWCSSKVRPIWSLQKLCYRTRGYARDIVTHLEYLPSALPAVGLDQVVPYDPENPDGIDIDYVLLDADGNEWDGDHKYTTIQPRFELKTVEHSPNTPVLHGYYLDFPRTWIDPEDERVELAASQFLRASITYDDTPLQARGTITFKDMDGSLAAYREREEMPVRIKDTDHADWTVFLGVTDGEPTTLKHWDPVAGEEWTEVTLNVKGYYDLVEKAYFFKGPSYAVNAEDPTKGVLHTAGVVDALERAAIDCTSIDIDTADPEDTFPMLDRMEGNEDAWRPKDGERISSFIESKVMGFIGGWRVGLYAHDAYRNNPLLMTLAGNPFYKKDWASETVRAHFYPDRAAWLAGTDTILDYNLGTYQNAVQVRCEPVGANDIFVCGCKQEKETGRMRFHRPVARYCDWGSIKNKNADNYVGRAKVVIVGLPGLPEPADPDDNDCPEAVAARKLCYNLAKKWTKRRRIWSWTSWYDRRAFVGLVVGLQGQEGSFRISQIAVEFTHRAIWRAVYEAEKL